MSNASVHVRAGSTQRQHAQLVIGLLLGSLLQTDTLVNKAPQAKQVTTIAIPASPDNSTTYSVVVDGVTASYTSDGSATQAEVGAGLLAALNASAQIRGIAVPSYSGGTLTLTGVWPAVSFTVTASGGTGGGAIGSPSTATSAAAANPVVPGRLMVCDGFSSSADIGASKIGHVPTTADFSAQVISLTFAGNTGGYYTGTVEINGKSYPWGGVVWNTDLNTTCTDIAAAINAVMPAETVIAASVGGGGGVVTLTAEVEGAEFDANAFAVGHATAEATKAYTTGPSMATSLRRALLDGGVAAYRPDLEHQTLGGDDPAYAANASVEVLVDGAIWVQNSDSPSYGDDVYVSLASATAGRFYNAAGTDRVFLPPEMLRWQRTTRAGASYTTSAALLRVNLK